MDSWLHNANMATGRRGRGQGRGRGGLSNVAQSIHAMDNMRPPEDFRDLSVFPTVADLHAATPPFLRRNLVKGAYANPDHYLDVQFRLMREDFVSALREGVADYRINRGATDDFEKHKKKEIKVYKDVTFVNINLTKGDLSILIEFDPREVPNPENAFMNGSLLCFSMDNFEDIIFATVAESFPEGVANGNIRVKLHSLQDVLKMSLGDKYTMVEPDNFFDPYHHVLCALQSMALEWYPMRDFIVGSRRIVGAPKYLSSTPCAVYDINDHQVTLFDDASWPSAKELGLNTVQYRAFKMALCSELALIQGPPGTGKTYLGVQVVRTLIENLEATGAGEEVAPILVVCATNHALDQFLEHLTTVTSDLVRCGGQSQSHILEPFMLSKLRRKYRRVNRAVEKMAAESEKAMNTLTKRLRRRLEDISKIVKHRGIVSLQSLSEIVGSHEELATFRDGQLGDDQLLPWLEDQKLDNASNPNLTNNESHDTSCISYVIDLDHINSILKNYARQVENLRDNFVKNKHGGKAVERAKDMVKKLNTESENLQDRRDRIADSLLASHTMEISEQTAATYKSGNAWQLATVKRWHLYHHWVSAARAQLEREVFHMITMFNTESSKYKACKMELDLDILKEARVVGMTTSCSARLRPLLDNLKPKIMVVEEAAEVLEGHIVASLTKHCQHVILIGDHKQLRPKTSSHTLTDKYQLDVSLFERLLNNGLPCVTLNVQHRMQPAIAQLIVPAIYPQLSNHHSVTEREDVTGVAKNVFFVTHNEPDELALGMSRKNIHEAELVIALCRYLLLQEAHTSDKITIITTYAAQVAMIESERSKHDDMKLKSVRVSTVDGFQGEENDIILLSLVRSNTHGQIGFLRTQNRVCVALSRAKNGLYIIGNMECLIKDKRSIWCAINKTLVKQQSIGTHLTVRCKKHKRHIRVSRATDFHFEQVEKHGCPLGCEQLDDEEEVLKPKHTNRIITQEFFNTALSSVARKTVDRRSDDKENLSSLTSARQHLDLNPKQSNEIKPTMSVPPLIASKVHSVPPTRQKYGTKNAAGTSEKDFDSYFDEETSKKSTTQTGSSTQVRRTVADRMSSQHFFSADYGRTSATQPSFSSTTPSAPSSETLLRRHQYQNAEEVTMPPKETGTEVDSWTKYFGDSQSKTIRDQPFAGQSHTASVEPPLHTGAIPKSSSTAYAYNQRPVDLPIVSRQTPSIVSQEIPRITPMVVPQNVPRVTPWAVPQEVTRVTPWAVPQEVTRITPRVVPQEVSRVTPWEVPQEVTRVTPWAVPQEVSRVTPRVVPQVVSRVTPRVVQNNVEFGADALLGIHRRPPVWQTPDPVVEKKKKKCIIM